MATQFPEIMDQEDAIAPIPAVPNYLTFQRSISVSIEGVSLKTLDLRGVTIEPTTEYIYVTDVKNSIVHIFSLTGDYINHFGDSHLIIPWGILIHQDRLYVTDAGHHAIFLFKLPDLQMVKKVGKQGHGQEEFNFPKQLAISPHQHLYVADMHNHRVKILTADLEFTETLQHHTMSFPTEVKFSNNEMFVLSGKDSPCIHVFSLSGRKTRSLLTNGLGMQVRRPRCFCFDVYNNILISYYPDQTKVFSREGDLLHTIGGTTGGVNHYYGFIVNNNKHIYVYKEIISICKTN